ncbi:MAG TPA: hypothetical protein EYQ23_09205 [Verrucomicrobiales bacterium]|nr:hypothetical protein [Verrucomicrobiales bacterium]
MNASRGTQIATFKIHYDNGSNEEFPVIAVSDIVDWANRNAAIENLGPEKIGWTGKATGWQATLSELIWENPHPDKVITKIDFLSNKGRGAPFLVGITLE